jgi:hypothetical protein
MEFLTSNPMMWLFGLITHFVLVLSNISTSRKKLVSPWQYIKERPYKVVLAVIGAIVGYSMLGGAQLPGYVYFGAGYMANDALDEFGSMANKSRTQVLVGQDGTIEKIRQHDQTILDMGRRKKQTEEDVESKL